MNNAKYTHKTRDGRLARIVSTDAVGNYPIVALVFDQNNNSEFTITLTENLTEFTHGTSNRDLVPYSVWEDVPVDTNVWVRNDENDKWLPRHFAYYVAVTGLVHTYDLGQTSFSTPDAVTESWKYAKLAD